MTVTYANHALVLFRSGNHKPFKHPTEKRDTGRCKANRNRANGSHKDTMILKQTFDKVVHNARRKILESFD